MAEDQRELFDESAFAPTEAAERGAPSPAPRVPDHCDAHHPPRGHDEDLTRLAAHHAADLHLRTLAKRVEVEWNPRLRTAAGRAFFRSHRIELNPKLQQLPQERREEEIRRTFLHELAHLVSHARARGRHIAPHGPEWRRACEELGIPDEDRCHSLEFQPRRQRRKFAYECPACGSVVERVRRVKRPVACYHCCRAHADGRYDARFQLVERPLT